MSDHEPDERELGRVELEGTPLDATISHDDVRAMLDGMKRRQQSSLALHRLMEQTGQIREATLVEYRCRTRGCLLGRIFSTPAGPALYLPGKRYSPERNDATNPQARAERTADGVRRWHETAELVMDWNEPWLSCDHVLDHPLEPGTTARDIRTRRGEVVLIG